MSVIAKFEIEHLQYLDPAGKLAKGKLPDCAKDIDALVEAYKLMVFTRSFDTKAVALQRTGKLGTYASCLGHEAVHVAVGQSLQYDDVLGISYREYGAMFARGVKPREVLLYWGGDERGSDFSGPPHDYPFCVPISTQCLHAAGAALAFKLRGEPRCALAMCGDGGTSKTDFYAALNSAGAYNLPLVLVVVNNQWAISVPRKAQTGAQTLAQKGIAGGLESLQVDGNDYIAVRAACDDALKRARNGDGGTVIEAVTYRLGDHTTADDARRYREDAEVKAAWEREPMLRLKKWLTDQGAWSDEQETQWKKECGKRVDEEVDAYLAVPPPPIEAMFDYLYADMPPDLIAQRDEAKAREAR